MLDCKISKALEAKDGLFENHKLDVDAGLDAPG